MTDDSDQEREIRKAQVNYEHEMRLWAARDVRQMHLFTTHSTFLGNLSSVALNSVILGNGAAAVAVLTFLSSMWGKPEMSTVMPPALYALTIYAIGVLAAMVSAGFGYVGQYCYAAVDLWANEIWKKRLSPAAKVFHVLSVLAACAGIVSFGWGSYEGLGALAATKGGGNCHDAFGWLLCSK